MELDRLGDGDLENPVNSFHQDKTTTTDEDTSAREAIMPQSPPAEVAAAGVYDRGSKAWLAMFGGWLVMFCVFGMSNSFGVFQDLYTRNHTASSANIAWIGSTQGFLVIFMSLPAGRLVDSGYFRPTLLGGSIAYTFFIFMLSLAHVDKYYQLVLAQGLGLGFSGGFLYCPAIAVQTRHWKARRSLATGVVFSGSALGGVVWPILLNHLFYSTNLGFGWSVRIVAFMILGLLVLANLIMTPGTQPPTPPGRKPSIWVRLRKMATDIPYILLTVASLIITLGLLFPYYYIQVFSLGHGIDANISFYLLAIINATSAFGRVAAGYAGDRAGAFNTYLASCVGTCALLFALFGATHTGSLIVFCALYGIFSGGAIALYAPSVVSILQDFSDVATRIGAAFCILAFGALIGPPINGALLGDNLTWWKAVLVSAIFIVFGTAITGLAWLLVARKKGARKF